MEILGFIQSVSKVAIGAFVVTSGFIFYELLVIFRSKKGHKKPVVPTYEGSKAYYKTKSSTPTKATIEVHTTTVKNDKRPLMVMLFTVVGLMAIAGAFFLFQGRKATETQKRNVMEPQTLIQKVSSSGISIYGANWQKIAGSTLKDVVEGQEIYVGIATIPSASIDKARIRINDEQWRDGDVTNLYNEDLKIFYREYSVSTAEPGLRIEAELHQSEKGWLSN